MRRLLVRLARDLLLLPLIAVLVYEFVAHLPVRRDDDAKRAVSSAVQQELETRLCIHRWDGFLCPWEDLLAGRSLAGDASVDTYDARHLGRALAGSLRIGGLALVFALLVGTTFAFLRVVLARTPADQGLELWPTLVYATPSFLLALLVARFTSVSYDDDKAAFEPIAAAVIAIGPGTFVGVILHDALRAETVKPYFTTALAKGRTFFAALLGHALPNAVPAVLDALGPVATSLLAGSFVAEKLFNVTYLGYLYVDAARNKQLSVVVVTTTLFAAILVVVSLAVELVRLVLDPKKRAQALRGDL